MLTKGALLALGAACGLVAAMSLHNAIRGLIRLNAAREIAVLPVLAEQPVFLSAAGDVLVEVRTKLLATRFAGVSFALRYAGGAVEGRPVLMRARRTDLAGRVTLTLHRFKVPQPGEYMLSANGLGPQGDDTQARLVLARPNDGELLLRFLQSVASAGALVASAVVIGLALAGQIGR